MRTGPEAMCRDCTGEPIRLGDLVVVVDSHTPYSLRPVGSVGRVFALATGDDVGVLFEDGASTWLDGARLARTEE